MESELFYFSDSLKKWTFLGLTINLIRALVIGSRFPFVRNELELISIIYRLFA
jgi:hypothetical protein